MNKQYQDDNIILHLTICRSIAAKDLLGARLVPDRDSVLRLPL